MKKIVILLAALLTSCQLTTTPEKETPTITQLAHVKVTMFKNHTVVTLTSGSEATVVWSSEKGSGSDSLYSWSKTQTIGLGSDAKLVVSEK